MICNVSEEYRGHKISGGLISYANRYLKEIGITGETLTHRKGIRR